MMPPIIQQLRDRGRIGWGRCQKEWSIWFPKARDWVRNAWIIWFPKARDWVRQNVTRGNRNVEYSAGCAFLCLILIAIASAVIWATGRSPKTAKATPAPTVAVSKLARPVSSPAPDAPSSSPEALPTGPGGHALITTEAEGRAEALRLYPALGTANTPLNNEFVARYNRYRQDRPEFFRDPSWPLILAKECADYLLGGQ